MPFPLHLWTKHTKSKKNIWNKICRLWCISRCEPKLLVFLDRLKDSVGVFGVCFVISKRKMLLQEWFGLKPNFVRTVELVERWINLASLIVASQQVATYWLKSSESFVTSARHLLTNRRWSIRSSRNVCTAMRLRNATVQTEWAKRSGAWIPLFCARRTGWEDPLSNSKIGSNVSKCPGMVGSGSLRFWAGYSP